MKTIGIIGGMSWESTTEYYKIINFEVKKRLGGLHSANVIINSVDFDFIEKFQSEQKWQEAGEFLAQKAISLERAGADFILIATNTMHKVFSRVKNKVKIPLIHIAQPVILKLEELKLKKLFLLGTKYVMEQDFYKELYLKNNIDIIVPEKENIEVVNGIIFNELCVGKFSKFSEDKIVQIIDKAIEKENIQGVILGCTELELLIKQNNVSVPIFKTAEMHAQYAVEKILE